MEGLAVPFGDAETEASSVEDSSSRVSLRRRRLSAAADMERLCEGCELWRRRINVSLNVTARFSGVRDVTTGRTLRRFNWFGAQHRVVNDYVTRPGEASKGAMSWGGSEGHVWLGMAWILIGVTYLSPASDIFAASTVFPEGGKGEGVLSQMWSALGVGDSSVGSCTSVLAEGSTQAGSMCGGAVVKTGPIRSKKRSRGPRYY